MYVDFDNLDEEVSMLLEIYDQTTNDNWMAEQGLAEWPKFGDLRDLIPRRFADGEVVSECIPHIGYLHCGFEKIGEYRQYNQIIPWTDREDYLNSPGNNVAFALISANAAARMGMTVFMYLVPPARADGLRQDGCAMGMLCATERMGNADPVRSGP